MSFEDQDFMRFYTESLTNFLKANGLRNELWNEYITLHNLIVEYSDEGVSISDKDCQREMFRFRDHVNGFLMNMKIEIEEYESNFEKGIQGYDEMLDAAIKSNYDNLHSFWLLLNSTYVKHLEAIIGLLMQLDLYKNKPEYSIMYELEQTGDLIIEILTKSKDLYIHNSDLLKDLIAKIDEQK